MRVTAGFWIAAGGSYVLAERPSYWKQLSCLTTKDKGSFWLKRGGIRDNDDKLKNEKKREGKIHDLIVTVYF